MRIVKTVSARGLFMWKIVLFVAMLIFVSLIPTIVLAQPNFTHQELVRIRVEGGAGMGITTVATPSAFDGFFYVDHEVDIYAGVTETGHNFVGWEAFYAVDTGNPDPEFGGIPLPISDILNFYPTNSPNARFTVPNLGSYASILIRRRTEPIATEPTSLIVTVLSPAANSSGGGTFPLPANNIGSQPIFAGNMPGLIFSHWQIVMPTGSAVSTNGSQTSASPVVSFGNQTSPSTALQWNLTGTNITQITVQAIFISPGQITGVSVIPPFTSIPVNTLPTPLQFHAIVFGSPTPPQGVVWSTTGAFGVTISPQGQLFIPSTVPVGSTITVWATSVHDSRFMGSAVVMITPVGAAAPIITGVDVFPNPMSRLAGQEHHIQFSAIVRGPGNPPQAVTWDVFGELSPYISITQGGWVTVSSDAPPGSASIRAASVYNAIIFGEADLFLYETDTGVGPPTVPGPGDAAPDDSAQDDQNILDDEDDNWFIGHPGDPGDADTDLFPGNDFGTIPQTGVDGIFRYVTGLIAAITALVGISFYLVRHRRKVRSNA